MSEDLVRFLSGSPQALELALTLVVGAVGSAVLLVASYRSSRITVQAADAVAQAAHSGQRDRARVDARAHGRPLAMLLDALSGGVDCPPAPSPSTWRPVLIAAWLPVGWSVFRALSTEDPVTTVLAAAVATGTASLAFIAIRLHAVWSADARRRVRGLAVALMRENARAGSRRMPLEDTP